MDQSPPPPPPLPSSPAPSASTSSDVRLWCVLSHASALLGLFLHFLGHLLGPLVVWLIKRGDSPEIDAHGKESLNFQISMLIYDAIAAILCLVLIGIPILIVLWILNTIFVIIASVQASEGKLYRYPLAIRFIK
jgi:uncharacterized Tic20 family protein